MQKYMFKYLDLRLRCLDLAGVGNYPYWFNHYQKLVLLCQKKDKEQDAT